MLNKLYDDNNAFKFMNTCTHSRLYKCIACFGIFVISQLLFFKRVSEDAECRE